MKYYRLRHKMRKAAWSGSKWVFRNGTKYGVHESVNACMHLEFCLRIYPGHPFLLDIANGVRQWFARSALSSLHQFRTSSAYIAPSTHLILLWHLNRLGLAGDLNDNDPAIEEFARATTRIIKTVRRLETAAEYFTTAYGLKLHGYQVNTKPLEALQSRLPPIRSGSKGDSKIAHHAFDYCSHLVLFETRNFQTIRAELSSRRFARWMYMFWVRTRMRESIEFLAEFLSCAYAIGRHVPRDDVADSFLYMLDTQSTTGCWQGSSTTTRYNRFHTAWLAAEALHLGRRLL